MSLDSALAPDVIERYRAQGHWGKSHPAYFDEAVQRGPDRTAIVDRETRYTYAELDRLVRRAAHAFVEAGIEAGDVVGIQLPNWAEFVIAHYALARIGAVTLPLLLGYRAHELEFMLGFAEARALIVPGAYGDFDYASLLRQVLPRVRTVERVFVASRDPGEWTPFGELIDPGLERRYDPERMARRRPRSTDVMMLVFTSGTTGNPKGIVHTHDTLMCVAGRMVRDFGYTAEDRVLGLSPLPHLHGIFGHIAPALVAGATTVLLERFLPARALELAQQERATIVVGVPSHALMLLNAPGAGACALGGWRLFFCSGATLPVEIATRLYRTFGCRVTSAYGMSEACYCTYSRLDDPFEVVATSCGRPATGVDIRIYDEGGRECPVGTAGEIAMRGPHLFVGYHKNPGAFRALTDAEGFFRSGDLGLLRDDGNLVVVGRKTEMIIRGGANVYPSDVEEVLLRHPKVRNVAVVGYPDQRLGERVCACVIPVPGQSITLDEVREFLADQIARYKIPDRIEVLDEFPMTGTGKVRKRGLKEHVAARLEEGARDV